MIRRVVYVGTAMFVFAVMSSPSRAQNPGMAGMYQPPYSGPYSYFGAPGYYGMAYGVPGYGSVRTYSAFSSPYGGGYAYGYAPYTFAPGPYGIELWRPGRVSTGSNIYAPGAYRTFPAPYRYGAFAPVGAYAPALGPPSYYSW